MVDSKKKWMSILDSLGAAGTPSPAPSVSNSRPLRAARDAVDGHKVWDIDPADVIDDRISDRLDPRDVADLRDSIEATGQTVPILLRRHPAEADKYLLVYGRRRLEAIRSSQSVPKVRALIAQMDDASAVEAQVSENMARRDLSYIEKALFAHELVESGFGNQSRVAEVLTVSRSAISMAINTVSMIGVDLIRAIGPADTIGRPRWDALANAIEAWPDQLPDLIDLAERERAMQYAAPALYGPTDTDPSVAAFEAVFNKAAPKQAPAKKSAASADIRVLGGPVFAKLRKSSTRVDLRLEKSAFADWFADHASDLISDLHARWKAGDPHRATQQKTGGTKEAK